MARRFPSKPPPTQREQPWRYARKVAPDMSKPRLPGESNTDFLIRCYREDERFTIAGGNACVIAGVPELPEWRKRANAKKRANPYRYKQ